MVTWGWTIVRAPIEAPAPIDTNGPMDTCSPSTASAAIAANACTPGAGRSSGAKTPIARENARYGLPRAENGAWRGGAVVRQDDGRRARGGDGFLIPGVGQEGDVARAGFVDARHAQDLHVAIAFEAAVEPGGQIAQLHRKGL